jgi:glycosyltransferase involved in cell wall biosynthesis
MAPATPAALRVAFFGTHPKQFNGYSKVVYELCKAVVARDAERGGSGRRIDLHVFGFQNFHNHPGHRNDVPIEVTLYDAHANETPHEGGFGVRQARAYVERVRPDVCVVFNDLKVLTAVLNELAGASNRAEFKIVAYIDQVYANQRADLVEGVDKVADVAIAFTPEWRECIQSQGLTLPCHVLEHGFDTAKYFPIPRRLVRRHFSVSEDDFLVLNLNRNTPRKRWDTCMQAFAEVVRRRPEASIKLVIATEMRGTWDLMALLVRELRKRGVAGAEAVAAARVVVPGHPQMLTDEETNVLYNLADVGVNTCDGEGFGMCNFEQAAIGIPQIVPRVGGFRRFFDDTCALMVDPVANIYVDSSPSDPIGCEVQISRPDDFATAILAYYDQPALRHTHGAAARARITSDFKWSRIADDFARILDDVWPADASAPAPAPAPEPEPEVGAEDGVFSADALDRLLSGGDAAPRAAAAAAAAAAEANEAVQVEVRALQARLAELLAMGH